MPLQASWVDRIFGRLALRYGAAFLRQWSDADISAVKADWAEVLENMPGEALGYAMRYLPNNPPNAMQFRDVCRRAPEPSEAPRLAAPAEAPERMAEAVALARSALHRVGDDEESPAAICIRNIQRIVALRGGRMSVPQRLQIEGCRSMLFDSPSNREEAELAKRAAQEAVEAYVEAHP